MKIIKYESMLLSMTTFAFALPFIHITMPTDGITIVKTETEHIPYSFLNCIFLPKGETDPKILRHEISHVRNHHSLDIIFIEIATAFQWFNPFMRLIKKDLQNIHEYTADRDVIDDGADKTDYMMLILQQCTASGTGARPGASTNIGNNFSFLLTKKRIKMITQKKKTKGLIFKALLTIPVFALLLLANCKTANSKPDETAQAMNRFDGGHKNVALNDSIYLQPEQQAEFPGGTGKMLTFISENIKYPQSAMEKGLEGKCYIRFVIEVDGSVTNAECLQGFDDECIAEALRVVSSMPKWKPGKNDGKPVRVQYLMPVAFQME